MTTTETKGHLCCFSNVLLKCVVISMTLQTPKNELIELANRIPLPDWKIEFAKKVSDPSVKETKIHELLTEKRVCTDIKLFKITPEEVYHIFDIFEGDIWEDKQEPEQVHINKCRDMKLCFYDGQKIRHITCKTSDQPHIWEGVYDAGRNEIIRDDKRYSLNKFAVHHLKDQRAVLNRKTFTVNAWCECECETNGIWISIFDLPVII